MLNMSSDRLNEKWILSPCWSKASYMLPFQVNPTNIRGYSFPSVILAVFLTSWQTRPTALRTSGWQRTGLPWWCNHRHDDLKEPKAPNRSDPKCVNQCVSKENTVWELTQTLVCLMCTAATVIHCVIYSTAGSKTSSVEFKITTVMSTKVNWMVISNSKVKDKLNVCFFLTIRTKT